MSVTRPHAARDARCRAMLIAGCALLALAACSDGGPLAGTDRDGSFGTGVDKLPRDGGLDGSADGLDASSPMGGGSVRVRFIHGLVNLGPLSVCHDPDGAGPQPPYLLGEVRSVLGADFRGRSESITLPALTQGTLLLQHEVPRSMADAGRDAGAADAGLGGDAACAESGREATIPLPIDEDWLDPRGLLDDPGALELAPALAGAPSLTLLGSGLALSQAALAQRAESVRSAVLALRPGDHQAAEEAAAAELRVLQAALGARAVIHRDPPPSDPQAFSLSVFHAIPDVAAPSNEGTVGAIRLCITAGTRESNAVPKAPQPGVPFRHRMRVGSSFEPGLDYHFRVFAQRDFDTERKDCSTISSVPLAELMVARDELEGGRAYTLALLGAIAPSSVCSPGPSSLVRAGCARPASELGARIALFED